MFIVVAIVIFGIFVSLSYTLFGKTLQPQMVGIFETSFEKENPNYINQKYYGVNNIEITDDSNFVFENGKIIDYIGTDSEVVIPYKIDDKYVTKIGNMAFNSKGLTKVTIPNTVEALEDGKHWSHEENSGAFKGNKLKSIVLPDSIKHIGTGAFADNQLTNIIFPKNIKELGVDTFRNNKLVTLNLPDGLLVIGQDAFEMNKIKEVKLPESITTLGYCSFNINEIANLELNEGLKKIGSHSFSSNINLKTIKIPSTVENIDNYAFLYTSITDVELPAKTILSEKAFSEHIKITRKN